MLNKKLISLSLIGITVIGVTNYNTRISLASPAKLKSSTFSETVDDNISSNKLIKKVKSNLSDLKTVFVLGENISSQFITLTKNGSNIKDIKDKFDTILKQLDSIINKESKLLQDFMKDTKFLYGPDQSGKYICDLKNNFESLSNILQFLIVNNINIFRHNLHMYDCYNKPVFHIMTNSTHRIDGLLNELENLVSETNDKLDILTNEVFIENTY